MTGVPNTQAKLRELLAKLFEYRHELEAAEVCGDRITAQTVRRLIRTQHGIIRNHCRAMGMPLPPEVPKVD